MKRLLTLIACLCPLMGYVAMANEGDTIKVEFKGNTATVKIPATASVTSTVEGAYVTLTSTTTTEEYVYRLSGTTTSGGFTVNGSYKLTLELAGVNITSQQGAAINILCGKRIAVILDDGTYNSLVDCAAGSQKAAFYLKGHPEFEGGGVLDVTGNTKHAISASEYLQLKKTTGTINILSSASDGIHCGKGQVNSEHRYFEINGGVVNIRNVKGDCIDSDDSGIMNINGGIINANVVEDGAVGLKCDSILYMTGGEVNINVTGSDSEGIRACYDAQFMGGAVNINVAGDGSKGIKGKNKTDGLVKNGGNLHFSGTDFVFNVHGNDLKAADGTVDTNCRAVSSDATITRTKGQLDIYAYGNIESAYNADVQELAQGGTINLYRAPWSFYYADYQNDMTAYVALKIDNQTVSVSDYAIGAFMGQQCVGVAIGNYLRIYSNATTAENVSFRAYNLSTGNLHNLRPSKTVAFSANAAVSTAAAPITLTGYTTLRGDVNNDKNINIADVTALVNIILNKSSDTYLSADVNEDGTVNISDVTSLVNIILKRNL